MKVIERRELIFERKTKNRVVKGSECEKSLYPNSLSVANNIFVIEFKLISSEMLKLGF